MIEVILCCVTGGQRYKDMYVDASIIRLLTADRWCYDFTGKRGSEPGSVE